MSNELKTIPADFELNGWRILKDGTLFNDVTGDIYAPETVEYQLVATLIEAQQGGNAALIKELREWFSTRKFATTIQHNAFEEILSRYDKHDTPNRIFGSWPGDETDEEIAEYFDKHDTPEVPQMSGERHPLYVGELDGREVWREDEITYCPFCKNDKYRHSPYGDDADCLAERFDRPGQVGYYWLAPPAEKRKEVMQEQEEKQMKDTWDFRLSLCEIEQLSHIAKYQPMDAGDIVNKEAKKRLAELELVTPKYGNNFRLTERGVKAWQAELLRLREKMKTASDKAEAQSVANWEESEKNTDTFCDIEGAVAAAFLGVVNEIDALLLKHTKGGN